MAFGMFYACKCYLDLAILYHKNIQSPAVTRCRIPGIFSSKLSVLEKWKQYYRDFYEIYSVLCLPQPKKRQGKDHSNKVFSR